MNNIALHLVTPFAKLYNRWDKWYSARVFKKTWDNAYRDELDKMDKSDHPWYEPLVKNQRSYCISNESLSQKVELATQIQTFRIGCAAARRFSVLKNIVGVQPMTGPCSLVYYLGYKFNEETKTASLSIESRTVEAQSRRLQARWAIEAVEDLKASHNIDFESELISVMGHEIGTEMIAEVLDHLIQLGKDNDRHVETMPLTPAQYTSDVARQVELVLAKAGNDIARDTRRGAANFIVGTPAFVATLQSVSKSTFVETPDHVYQGLDLTHVGVLNGTIQVYASCLVKDNVIIGYKGQGDTDTGYVFCPYVPVISAGMVIDPNTFQPMTAFMTRNGYWANVAKGDNQPRITSNMYYRTFKEPKILDIVDIEAVSIQSVDGIVTEEVVAFTSEEPKETPVDTLPIDVSFVNPLTEKAEQPSVDQSEPKLDNQ